MGRFEQSSNTKNTGRNHWLYAFTPRSLQTAAYAAAKPVTPGDLAATILHHLGIDHTMEYTGEFQHLRNRLGDGESVRDLA